MHYRSFLLAILSLSFGAVAGSQMPPDDFPKVVWGVKETKSSCLLHTNGRLAWSGVRQGKYYDPAHAFYHAQGGMAWDGIKRTRNSWDEASEKGAFYHANGGIAWGGIPQKLNSWGEAHNEGVFFHANGKIAWSGIPQKLNTWSETRSDAFFYHSNGALGWGGLPLAKDRTESYLYHDNGRIAWDKNGVYDSAGRLMAGYADYVWLFLGEDSWLYVERDGTFTFVLSLGEGYSLQATSNAVNLNVLDTVVSLD